MAASGIFSADSSQDKTGTIAATTSTAEIVLGVNEMFALTVTGPVCIKFGTSGMTAAAGTNFMLPANIIAEYSCGNSQDRIRLYNPGASAISYFIQFLDQN